MPKKTTVTAKPDVFARVVNSVKLDDAITARMRVYGKTTVENRSIPDERDGLKPVHRRLLWAMHKMGIGYGPNATTVKCARITGETIGKFHPHGSDAAYGALVTLTGGAFPLINKQGNFGWYNSPAGAERYTEANLLKVTADLLLDKDYLAVTEMVPNYDGKDEEPIVLPSKLPMSLVLGSEGIAVGTTTLIPTFTIESVIKVVTKAAAKGVQTPKQAPQTTSKSCAKHLVLSTEYGGNVASTEADVAAMIKTGRGRIQWECDYEWIEKDKAFYIKGLAPGWNVTSGLNRLRNLAGVYRVDDISTMRNNVGIRIMVTLQKGVTRATVEPHFKKAISSAKSVVINTTVRSRVDDRGLMVSQSDFQHSTVADLINRWFKWRWELEKRVQARLIQNYDEALAREALLMKAITNLDLIFKLLKTKGIDKAAELAKALKISMEDAKYIWTIAVGRLDRLNEEDIKAKMAKINADKKLAKERSANPATVMVQDMKTLLKDIA